MHLSVGLTFTRVVSTTAGSYYTCYTFLHLKHCGKVLHGKVLLLKYVEIMRDTLVTSPSTIREVDYQSSYSVYL